MAEITFSVFTKPWKDLGIGELGAFVKRLGFDGIEFPLRPGYQVLPENAEKGLPELARAMGDHGVKITSVAGPTDERTFAACAKAGVPVIRIMLHVGKEPYLQAEARFHRELAALVPLCKRYGITVGIQNHCGEFVNAGTGLRRMVEPYDRRHVAAVWDAAHIGLGGEEIELSLDIVWSHLCMVNLKNAFWRRVNGPEAAVAQWEWFWTSGRQGLASWPRVAKYLKDKSYGGVICLTAEYTAEDQVNRLIAEDIVFARSLFA